MNDDDLQLMAARQAADQQMIHLDDTLTQLLADAQRLVDQYDGMNTDATCHLLKLIYDQLHDRSMFLAELLARLAVVTVNPPEEM